MRKINKEQAPDSFKKWAKPNKNQSNAERYKQIFDEERWDILDDVADACTQEQFYLCAYCCQRISGELIETRIEHVEARSIAPQLILDFSNLVTSCKTINQCDAAHGSQNLPLTPLMIECEIELKFKLSGRVEGTTERARISVKVLNIGDKNSSNIALIDKRKSLVDALIWRDYGADPADLEFEEDKELLEILIEDLKQPINGALEAYSPVLVNILSQYLNDL